jgi:hypothetical protein
VFVAVQPIHGGLHRGRSQAAIDRAATLFAIDQAGVQQHVEVLHDRRQRLRERPRQLAHRDMLALPQPADQRPPGRVGKRGKDAVEYNLAIVNHWVKCKQGRKRLSTPQGSAP